MSELTIIKEATTTDTQVLFDLSIRLDTLEMDAIRQVEMMKAATRSVAKLRKEHSTAKNAQELVEARLKRSIRREPSKFGIVDGKTGNEPVNEAMIVQPSYQNAVTSVIDAKYRLDLMEGIIQTLEHRKRMIEKECDLWGQSYFAKPVIKGSSAEVRDNITTSNKRAVRSRVNPVTIQVKRPT